MMDTSGQGLGIAESKGPGRPGSLAIGIRSRFGQRLGSGVGRGLGRGQGQYNYVTVSDDEKEAIGIELVTAVYKPVRTLHSAVGKSSGSEAQDGDGQLRLPRESSRDSRRHRGLGKAWTSPVHDSE